MSAFYIMYIYIYIYTRPQHKSDYAVKIFLAKEKYIHKWENKPNIDSYY